MLRADNSINRYVNGELFNNATAPKVQIVAAAGQVRHSRIMYLKRTTSCIAFAGHTLGVERTLASCHHHDHPPVARVCLSQTLTCVL